MATVASGSDVGGIALGRIVFTPGIEALYTRGEASLETAQPVDDEYFEVRPQVGVQAPLGSGEFRGGYRAHIRRGSSFEIVESTISHVADVGLSMEAGSVAEVNATAHFARGVLEASEVDPGREYFFELGRYSRRLAGLSARVLSSGRADVTLAGSHDVIRVDDRAAFFDYERSVLRADVGYELGPVLRATVGYSYMRIPFTAERPEAESSSHSVGAGVHGELMPLTVGQVNVSYTRQTSPNAALSGRRFTGVTASGRVEKSFTPSTTLALSGGRSTNVSAFERNAFYVTNSLDVNLRAALPGAVALAAGVGWHRNTYQTVSTLINAPRRDGIRGWTVGLGRPMTSRAFVRADYRRERRDSNIDGFDTTASALTVEVGVFAAEGRR